MFPASVLAPRISNNWTAAISPNSVLQSFVATCHGFFVEKSATIIGKLNLADKALIRLFFLMCRSFIPAVGGPNYNL